MRSSNVSGGDRGIGGLIFYRSQKIIFSNKQIIFLRSTKTFSTISTISTID